MVMNTKLILVQNIQNSGKIKKLCEKREKIDFCISVPDFKVPSPKLNSNYCIFEKEVKIRIK